MIEQCVRRERERVMNDFEILVCQTLISIRLTSSDYLC